MSDLQVLDATGTRQQMSTTTNPVDGGMVGSTSLTDPSTGAKLNVGTPQAADGETLGSSNAIVAAATPMLINGQGTYDRQRNNVDAQESSPVLSLSAQAAGTVNSTDQVNYNGRGVQVGINVTSISGGSLVITIRGKDVVSGQYYALLASGSITTPGFYLLTLYPGASAIGNGGAAPNAVASQLLPRVWGISAVVGTGATVSATVGSSTVV